MRFATNKDYKLAKDTLTSEGYAVESAKAIHLVSKDGKAAELDNAELLVFAKGIDDAEFIGHMFRLHGV